MHGISIISVNWNAYDFARVLIESAKIFTNRPYEIIIVDNSTVKEDLSYENVKQFPQWSNTGHGEGLNFGSLQATYPFVLFLDIDCHFIKRGWDDLFFKAIEGFDVIAGRGVPEKPIRPACMFLKQEIAVRYDWRPTPGYRGHRITPTGFDVAIQAYHTMLEDSVKIKLIESQCNRYKTLNGEEWLVDNIPVVYHHWHGSHLKERQADFKEDLLKDKQTLFSKLPWRIL